MAITTITTPFLEKLIPGFPNPTFEDIKTFQFNNRCSVDGIIGPQTRAAIWPKHGNQYFAVRLAPYRYGHGNAMESIAYAQMVLQSNAVSQPLKVSNNNYMTLFHVVSSQWSCGFDWLTGEDGLTVGFRRFASTKVQGLFERYSRMSSSNLVQCFGPLEQLVIMGNEDAPNNSGLIAEPFVRAGLLELQKRPSWWFCQIEHTIEDWNRAIFDRYPEWSDGRLIALAVRSYNSGPGYLQGLPQSNSKAYKELCKRYTDVDDRRRSNRHKRIEDIEKLIQAGQAWR